MNLFVGEKMSLNCLLHLSGFHCGFVECRPARALFGTHEAAYYFLLELLQKYGMKAQIDDRVHEMIEPSEKAKPGETKIAHVLLDQAGLNQRYRVRDRIDLVRKIQYDELNC